MADAVDSKSIVGNNMRVQVPPSAPNKNLTIFGKVFVFVDSFRDLNGSIKQSV